MRKPRLRCRLNNESKDKIAACRKSGYTYARLIEEFQVSYGSISRILKSRNLIGVNYKNSHTKNRILELRDDGLSYRAISKRLGIHTATIWRTLKKHGKLQKNKK